MSPKSIHLTNKELFRPLGIESLKNRQIFKNLSVNPEELAALARRFNLLTLGSLSGSLKL